MPEPRPPLLAELQGSQLPPFTPTIVAWVRWSINQLPSDNARLLTDVFYEELFALAPLARAMFAEDMDPQKDRLLGALLAAAHGMDRASGFEPHLRRWGVIHRREHGVTDDLYVYVGQALIRTVTRLLSNNDSMIQSSWVAVYQWMAAVMIDGADQAEAIDKNPSLLLATPVRPQLPQVSEIATSTTGDPAPIATVHSITQRLTARPSRQSHAAGQ